MVPVKQHFSTFNRGIRSNRRNHWIRNWNGKTLLNGIAPNKITELGLARTFQNIRLFKDLTVLENVMVAMHAHEGNSLFSSFIQNKSLYETEKMMKEEALELLKNLQLRIICSR